MLQRAMTQSLLDRTDRIECSSSIGREIEQNVDRSALPFEKRAGNEPWQTDWNQRMSPIPTFDIEGDLCLGNYPHSLSDVAGIAKAI